MTAADTEYHEAQGDFNVTYTSDQEQFTQPADPIRVAALEAAVQCVPYSEDTVTEILAVAERFAAWLARRED